MNPGYYSSLAMVTSAVLYLLAMVAHTTEWAIARRLQPKRRGRALVLAGSGGPETVDGEDADPTRERQLLRLDQFSRVGIAITIIAWGVHLAGVVLRGVAAQRLPWGNMYEFVTSSLAVAVAVHLVLIIGRGWRWLGLPVTMLAAVGQGLAVTVFYVAVAPLVPALHSVWFIVHIIAAAVAGAVFNLGGIVSILYLLRIRAEERGRVRGYLARLPEPARLDTLAYKFHAFAFPLWTFTVLAGAIWAQFAWGRFWGWDPKETWSLVTWMVYAGYLHARATAGWRGRRAAWIAVIGLATFWFNFVGINLLASGLHSYAGI